MHVLDYSSPRLVLAMDHARNNGVIAGLEDPGKAIDLALDAGVDAVMTTFGVIKRYGPQLIGRVPVFLRLDGGQSVYREKWLEYTRWEQLAPLETALELGVNGVCVMLFVGSEVELDTIMITEKVATEALGTRLEVMCESLPCRSPQIPDPYDPGAMASACRIGFEHGADVLKTYYTGSAESFRHVTSNCPAPVMVAGGPKAKTVRDTFEMVDGSIKGGAAGLIFGRNIWQSDKPAGMVKALRHVMAGGSVDDAERIAAER